MPFCMSTANDFMAEETKDVSDIREALNRHGVFFKKAVLEEVSRIPGIERVEEEVGTTFGETRVADIVAIEFYRSEKSNCVW